MAVLENDMIVVSLTIDGVEVDRSSYCENCAVTLSSDNGLEISPTNAVFEANYYIVMRD